MRQVGEKRGELKGTTVERDPHLAQLLLYYSDHQPRVFVGGGLHRDVEAYAIDEWMARGIEQLVGAIGIMIVARDIPVVGPALRRKQTAGGLRLSSPQIFDHRLPVESIGDSLPHPRIFQNRIARVESQISQPGASSALDVKVSFPLQSDHSVGWVG